MALARSRDHGSVTTLTTPGTEAHDLELSPRQIASLAEAAAQLARIDSFVERAAAASPDQWFTYAARLPQDFADAMNDDLGTPTALAVLFRTVKEGNVAIEAGDDAWEADIAKV